MFTCTVALIAKAVLKKGIFNRMSAITVSSLIALAIEGMANMSLPSAFLKTPSKSTLYAFLTLIAITPSPVKFAGISPALFLSINQFEYSSASLNIHLPVPLASKPILAISL